ncbi:MAG: hypothetical protein Q9227_005360 [Pyrenula ochraceoflavens]
MAANETPAAAEEAAGTATETPSEPPRAGKYAQELLSTFSTTLGEVALQPSQGGTFTVTLLHTSSADFTTQHILLWDRKVEGGFPDPARSLGHVDRGLEKQRQREQEKEEDNEPKSAQPAARPDIDAGKDVKSQQNTSNPSATNASGECKDCA